jgi:cytochrome c553
MRIFRVILSGLVLALYIALQVSLPICLAENEATVVNSEASQTNQPNCASCHQQETDAFNAGIHSQNGMSCTDCHQAHDTGAGVHQDPMSDPKNIATTCGACHAGDVLKSYQESFHGRAVALGSKKSADCTSCHDSHKIVKSTDPASPVAQANLPATCAKCHLEPLENYSAGVEHKVLEANGAGVPQYNTFKFFVWLTIITVVCLILHMEMDLLHLFRKARRKE